MVSHDISALIMYIESNNNVDEMITHDKACQEQIRGVLQAQKAMTSLTSLNKRQQAAETTL